jgi:hypothetical protein
MSYVSKRQRRINQEIRNSIVRRLIDVVGQVIVVCLIAGCIALISLNWMLGCGERFPTDSNGNYVQGECVTPADLFDDYRQNQTTGSD